MNGLSATSAHCAMVGFLLTSSGNSYALPFNRRIYKVNFLDWLQLMFIGLKLTGHLDDWTWLLVLSPVVLSWGLYFCFIGAGVIVGACKKKSME